MTAQKRPQRVEMNAMDEAGGKRKLASDQPKQLQISSRNTFERMMATENDRMCFIANRNLLNPRFESYKLKEYDQSRIRTIPLSKPIDLEIRSGNQNKNYQELKTKSKWNHFLVGRFSAKLQLIWIEPKTLKISSLINPTSKDPLVSELLELPDIRSDQQQPGIEYDYPTGIALDDYCTKLQTDCKLWFILDGSNNLFLVDLNHSPQILARKELNTSDSFIHGFYTLSSVHIKDSQSDQFWMVLRSKSIQTTPRKKLIYTIYLVEIHIKPNPSQTETTLPFDLDIKIHTNLKGSDDLLSTHYDPINHRWCFRSTSEYTSYQEISESPPEEDEKVIKKEENMEIDQKSSAITPHPYNWNQTLDSLTIIFVIPFSITSKSIKIDIRSNALHFKLPGPLIPTQEETEQDNLDYLSNLFRYFGQEKQQGTELKLELWDQINAEESTWFIESSSSTSGTTTTLTIEIEKRSKLRWPHVFKIDTGVSEIMDPIELRSITENLAKYTSLTEEESNKQKRGGLGSLKGSEPSTKDPTYPSIQNTSLTAGEIDEEIDLGHNDILVTGMVMTWLTSPNQTDASNGTDWSVRVAQNGIPIHVISNPLKVINLDDDHPSEADHDSSIMIKSDIDGLVFNPPTDDTQDLQWTHTLTYPALAFVMASKREIWNSFYTPQFSLVFETSSSGSSSFTKSLGNLFVYYRATSDRQPISTQRVIQLSSSSPSFGINTDSGSVRDEHASILGICALSIPEFSRNRHAEEGGDPPACLTILILSQHHILVFDI
ncbi:hypothetical protein MJO29_004527 [Puccinia striiformis f. sp. tritici]|nr:hypothetical protein MJO29_004527 [Puccinia striiformis f. sp. tritici]